MSNLTNLAATAVTLGQTVAVFEESPTQAGTISRRFAIRSDSVLVSAWVGATSGTVDISVTTQHGDDTQSATVITFPTVTSPTSEIVLRKAAAVMQYITVTVTYSDACQFVVKARGIGTGEASVKLLGPNTAKNYFSTLTTTPSLIIPVALDDRSGIALHNTDSVKTIYMGFTIADTNAASGWEIGPGEKLGLDVASGVAVYGMVAAGTAKIKVLEAGS